MEKALTKHGIDATAARERARKSAALAASAGNAPANAASPPSPSVSERAAEARELGIAGGASAGANSMIGAIGADTRDADTRDVNTRDVNVMQEDGPEFPYGDAFEGDLGAAVEQLSPGELDEPDEPGVPLAFAELGPGNGDNYIDDDFVDEYRRDQ
ncbi:hypothetical protein EON77_09615 [bacterium]|nr:MAG: hypothetical protein EON77_09615 [bacterium]